jgi:hypothetical protein
MASASSSGLADALPWNEMAARNRYAASRPRDRSLFPSKTSKQLFVRVSLGQSWAKLSVKGRAFRNTRRSRAAV